MLIREACKKANSLLHQPVVYKSFFAEGVLFQNRDYNLDFPGTSQLFNVIPPFADFEKCGLNFGFGYRILYFKY